MRVDTQEVLRIARLAHLELLPDELESFRAQFEAILNYMEQLRELDTQGVPPTQHLGVDALEPGEDRPEPGLPTEVLERMAPEREGARPTTPRSVTIEGNG